ncbi:ATP phosphoribosyltransferase regulatory subunit [Helicobacter canadensis]|uniref:Histidyl-tRNA synthetase n=2 Tax=Helicobacter canadensis TaxID=123841 RepID=C5ZV78_9HELI|nr:ATP phosphoribosyltransferase regulatory subunit [Helicobacter canadensis]EES88737.1 Histidyl-tRNA synthetase [Helicobacter canadensis MIT 98-5491]STP00002.1 ATP phosphoribosyltransferase [Helicobacter canadensis]
MILSHEIPQDSKLYFGKSAKIKRDFENLVSEILYQNDYEEILTPTFSYLQYQRDMQSREFVRISNPFNHQITLRSDSTIDTIRLLAPHLKENNTKKKWFYIQPIFTYPTKEIHQIGVENLEKCDILPFIQMSLKILKSINIKPFLQLSNVKIPEICAKEFGLSLEVFEKNDVGAIQGTNEFLAELLEVQDKDSLKTLLIKAPESLKKELEILLNLAQNVDYENMILAPLFYSPMSYYKGMLFRFFLENQTMILGGDYEILEQRACGFGIYTDCVILHLIKEKK